MHESITCEEIEVGTAEYLDDVLPPDLRRRFESHLHRCPECRAGLQRTRWAIGRLSDVPREAMPGAMKARILRVAGSRPSPTARPAAPPCSPRWCSPRSTEASSALPTASRSRRS